MGQKKNVLVGSALMSYSEDEGTTWKELGYTEDGVTVDYEPTFQDHEVDEELLPVKKTKTKEKTTVTANLAENTLENYRVAMGLPASTLVTDTTAKTKTLNLKVNFDIPEHQLKLVGKSPDNLDRTIIYNRVVSVGKVSTKHNKKDKKLIPIEFEVLSDDTGTYGTIVDKTA